MTVLRNVLAGNNGERSKLLSASQRADMRAFLEKVTQYVPKEERECLLASGEIPTAAISWRPAHLAYERNDPWVYLREHWTDVFGNPIPSFEEYVAYRTTVELTHDDRERIRDCTSKKGWMSEEISPNGKGDIYRSGLVNPHPEDTVLYQFTVGKPRVYRKIFTMPEAVQRLRESRS
jgi:hypothetical protein